MQNGQEVGASPAIIYKLSTTLDGGTRLTLDLPSVSTELAAKLLKMKLCGQEIVTVAFITGADE